MNKQLSVKENVSLTLPGIELTGNSLTVLRELTADEARLALSTLRTVDDAGRFWIGDFLRHIKDTHTRQALKQNDATEADKIGEAAAREAAQQFADPMACCEAMAVTELLGGNRNSLSFRHHREALAECHSNPSEAMRWLERAQENGWSYKEMRQAIRQVNNPRIVSQDARGTPTLTGAVAKLNRQIVGMLRVLPLDEMDFDYVAELLHELEPIADQIELLKSRLKQAQES
jgi:hypothetical protein